MGGLKSYDPEKLKFGSVMGDELFHLGLFTFNILEIQSIFPIVTEDEMKGKK